MQCSGTNCNAEIMLTFTLMQVFGCAPKPGQYSDDDHMALLSTY